MADTEKQILSLDLDAKGFIHSAQEAKKVLSELGEIENIAGVLEGFATMGLAMATVGTALYALKAGFEFTLEAEKIKRVNEQFEILANNAGISSDKLKEGLEKSVAGLMDTDEALKLANKSVVELGKNAEKIPQIMELARKVTAVFGGDLADNFEKISQAVASGNTRILKHMGIIIDSDKALREYAKSVGKFVSDLTEQDKRTAILNATLDKGNKALKGAGENVNSLTTSWQKFKVGIKEIADFVVTKYESIFGGGFRAMIGYASDAIKSIGTTLTANYGTGIERTKAQADKLRDTIKSQTEDLEKAERMYVRYGTTVNGIYNNYKGKYESAKKALEDSKAELEKYDKYLEKHEELAKAREEESAKPALEANVAKHEAEIKFNQDVLKLRESRIMEQIALDESYDAIQEHRSEQLVIMHERMENEIREIEERARKEGIDGTEQAERMKTEAREKYVLDVRKLGQDMMHDQIMVANQSAKANQNSVDGFAKGWKSASLNASKDLGSFSKLGEMSFNALNKNAKNAFIALGDGSKTAGEAMKSFLLGAIADVAEAQGEFLLSSGIGTFNPVQIAEGGALLALSGLLRSLAGGGAGGIGASAGGGGGGGGASSYSASTPGTMDTLQTVEEAKPKRAVTIQVQGNYFETEQTKRTLMEMIRQETDATSFSYVQINQGGAS